MVNSLDKEWVSSEFIPKIQNRGAEIINESGRSSVGSAARAIVEHMRDWMMGSSDAVSMGVVLSKDNSFGLPEGLCISIPCTTKKGGSWEAATQFKLKEELKEMM